MKLRPVAAVALVASVETWLLVGPVGPPSSLPEPAWSAVERWYDAVGPVAATAALLRGVGILVGGWLLVVLVIQAAAAATSIGWLAWLSGMIAPRSIQRIGQGLAGLSLTAGLSVPAPGAGFPLADALRSSDPPGTATLRLLEPGSAPVADTSTTVPSPAPGVDPAGGPADPIPVEPPTDEVEVEPGDSFWSLAVEEVGDDGADERVVAQCWIALIEANRDRLVDPSNPDLIYPGQRFRLPLS